MGKCADGIVTGSAIVRIIKKNPDAGLLLREIKNLPPK